MLIQASEKGVDNSEAIERETDVTNLLDPSASRQEVEEPQHRSRKRWLASGAALLVLGAVIGVGSVALISTRTQVNSLRAAASARASALAAARSYSIQVASYDYRYLNQDFGAVEANSTASFRTQFQNSSVALKPVLTQYHAIAQAKVVAAGLESSSANQAVAVVFINQTVTNSLQKSGPTTDQSRLEVTLVRQRGHWLIQQLRLL